MADYVATTEDMTTVANAIRTKGGTFAPLSFPDEFASAIQAIPGPKPEQVKEISISENGDFPITPDVGQVLSKVLAHVDVPTGGGGSFDPSPFSKVEVGNFTPAVDDRKWQQGFAWVKGQMKAGVIISTVENLPDRYFRMVVFGPYCVPPQTNFYARGCVAVYSEAGSPKMATASAAAGRVADRPFVIEPNFEYGRVKFKAGQEYKFAYLIEE